jgi:hypothetical protein
MFIHFCKILDQPEVKHLEGEIGQIAKCNTGKKFVVLDCPRQTLCIQ